MKNKNKSDLNQDKNEVSKKQSIKSIIQADELDFSSIFDYHRHLFQEYRKKFGELMTSEGILEDTSGNLVLNKELIKKDFSEIEKLQTRPSKSQFDEIENKLSKNLEKSTGMNTRVPVQKKEGLKKYQNPLIRRFEAQIIKQTEPIFSFIKENNTETLGISSFFLDSLRILNKEIKEFYVQYINFFDYTKESVEHLHYTLIDFLKLVDDKFLVFKTHIENLNQHLESTNHNLNLNLENIFKHLNTKSDINKQEIEALTNEFKSTSNHFTKELEKTFNHLDTKSDLNKQEIEALNNKFESTSNHFTKELEKIFTHLESKINTTIQKFEDLDNRQILTANHFTKKLEELFHHLDTQSNLKLQRIEKLENDFLEVKDIANKLYNESVKRSSELFQINDMRQESVELKQAEILDWLNNMQKSFDDQKNKIGSLSEFDLMVKEKFDKIDEISKSFNLLKKNIKDFEQKGFSHIIPLIKEKVTDDKESKSKKFPTSIIDESEYFLFEERFRGKSEDIKKRQDSYISYFKNNSPVIDIGCGKGEFLDILKENNIESYGIDINTAMIEYCKNKGHNVIQSDLVKHLDSLEQDSIGGIFSAQTIEHIQPEKIISFIKLSYDKLKKGGNIIIETLNPLSLYSLTNFYYKDLFHIKPIHPQTLAFLLEVAGFKDIKINYISPVDKKEIVSQIENTYTYHEGIRENLEDINRNFSKINDFLYGFQEYFGVGVK